MKKFIIILFLLPLSVFAQDNKASLQKEARQLVREGNELYNNLKFSDAEVAYKKALENDPSYEIAQYNLGNALSQQNRTEEAVAQYELVAKTTEDKFTKAQAMHNIGNAFYQKKDYQKSVDAYKNSMRANPKDDETRYNLALAQEKLKEQQEQQEKDKDNKDDKKDDQKKDDKQDKKDGDDEKDQDKKNEDDKKEGEDDKKDDKKDGDDKQNPEKDKKDDKQQQKPKQGQLSPQQIKQLLEAMNNEEKKTQEKMNAKKERGKKIKQEKDW